MKRREGNAIASIVRQAGIEAPAAHCWAAVLAFDALRERLGDHRHARGAMAWLTREGVLSPPD